MINDVSEYLGVVGIQIISLAFSFLEDFAIDDFGARIELLVAKNIDKNDGVKNDSQKTFDGIVADPLVIFGQLIVLLFALGKILVKRAIVSRFIHRILLYNQDKNSAMRLVRTIVAPVGVLKVYEAVRPIMKQIMERMAEMIILPRKVRLRWSAERQGKIMRLETSNAPSMRMPITIINEHKTARIVLYSWTLMPMALAKFSSNVIANI